MKDKGIISIIIPNFNGEKYITRCLESIIGQDEGRLEIIIVDDGSVDNSKEVIRNYIKEKSNNFKIIFKTNGGVSSARNAGIEVANGEYILFLDSDDTLEKNAINKMLTAIQDNDVLVFSYLEYNQDQNTTKRKSQMEAVVNGDELRDNLFYYTSRTHFYSPCNKLFKASLLKENNILFPLNITTGEDYIFNLHVAEKVKKIKFENLYLYRYYDNPVSVTHKLDMHRWKNQALMIQETYKLNPKRSMFETEFIVKRLYGVYSTYSSCLCHKQMVILLKNYWNMAYDKVDLSNMEGKAVYKFLVELAKKNKFCILCMCLNIINNLIRLKYFLESKMKR